MFCEKCGAEITETDSKFCPTCGAPIIQKIEAEIPQLDITEKKSKRNSIPIPFAILGVIIIGVFGVFIYFYVYSNSPSQVPVVPQGEEFVQNREILDWYTSLGQIQTKTSDSIPKSVIVDVVFGYKKDDKATSTEITQKTVEIKDFLHRYFTQKTEDELRPQNEENLKIDIRNLINDKVLTNTKIKDVRFMKLDVVQ